MHKRTCGIPVTQDKRHLHLMICRLECDIISNQIYSYTISCAPYSLHKTRNDRLVCGVRAPGCTDFCNAANSIIKPARQSMISPLLRHSFLFSSITVFLCNFVLRLAVTHNSTAILKTPSECTHAQNIWIMRTGQLWHSRYGVSKPLFAG